MNDSPRMPAPENATRDAQGRLIELSFCSEKPPQKITANSWLVAVDGSAHSQRAVTETLRLAKAMAPCAIDLVNVQSWLAKETAETQLSQRGWDASATARALLDQAGQPWRLHVLMGESAERIVALAEALGSGGIVIGSHGLDATHALLLGSVAYKVIHLAAMPVLIVR